MSLENLIKNAELERKTLSKVIMAEKDLNNYFYEESSILEELEELLEKENVIRLREKLLIMRYVNAQSFIVYDHMSTMLQGKKLDNLLAEGRVELWERPLTRRRVRLVWFLKSQIVDLLASINEKLKSLKLEKEAEEKKSSEDKEIEELIVHLLKETDKMLSTELL